MTAQLIDGKAIAQQISERVKTRVHARIENGLQRPGLAVIQVGKDPASSVYVRKKLQMCDKIGIQSTQIALEETIDTNGLLEQVKTLNEDERIHGILVQLPLPAHIDTNMVIDAISPQKDIDGFHPHNLGLLAQRRPQLRPCTPKGIITLLDMIGYSLSGKNVLIVGASNIVGRPMALELLLAKATPTVAHRFTKDLDKLVAAADCVIVAVGKPGIVQSNWITPGTVLVDVGINRLDDGRLVGDIDFETAKERASWITPVPGGVGPMTVATLMENTLQACESQTSTL